MKKLLLTISASLLLAISANAQDMGMETWQNVPLSTTIQDPTGWASFNVAVLLGATQSVYKITTPPADVYMGTASAKVTTIDVGSHASVPNPFRPFVNFNYAGILGMGTTMLSAPYIKFGQPVPAANPRPVQLTFASKYSPMGTDSAFVVAYLTHWNVNHRDTVARGKYYTNVATSNYAVYSVPLTYNPAFAAVTPDTQQVYISSSSYLTDGVIGSAFFVDGFCWDCNAGVNEVTNEISFVSVSPNPATTEINFQCSKSAQYLEVFDISGRKSGLFLMQNNKVKIQTESFTPGFYLYNVLNSKKEVINRGKF